MIRIYMEMMIVCLCSLNGKAVNHCPTSPLLISVQPLFGKIFKSLLQLHKCPLSAGLECMKACFVRQISQHLTSAVLQGFQPHNRGKVGLLRIRRLLKERNTVSVSPAFTLALEQRM